MSKVNSAKIPGTKKIQVLVSSNPKKAGSAPAKRFALVRKCGTVADVVASYEAKGLTPRLAYADLRWDAAREHIKLV